MAFKPNSLVVIAGRRGWLPTQSTRWRRALEAAGHFVVFVDTSTPNVLGSRQESIGDRQSASAVAEARRHFNARPLLSRDWTCRVRRALKHHEVLRQGVSNV
jgi:hypothetical protein